MLLPEEISIHYFQEELVPALAWAGRHDLEIIKFGNLGIRLVLTQKKTGSLFYLQGEFDSYKAMPPKWVFMDELWEKIT